MKIVTAWSVWNAKHNTWEHNHIEDGYANGDIPGSDNPAQVKAWKQQKWKKTFGYLNDENVMVIV